MHSFHIKPCSFHAVSRFVSLCEEVREQTANVLCPSADPLPLQDALRCAAVCDLIPANTELAAVSRRRFPTDQFLGIFILTLRLLSD